MTNLITVNGITINTERVKKIFNKKVLKIIPPTSTAQVGATPKKTKFVDLLKIEYRFDVDGTVQYTDRAAMVSAFETQGTVVLVYDGNNYDVIMDKMELEEISDDRVTPETLNIKFTATWGEDI